MLHGDFMVGRSRPFASVARRAALVPLAFPSPPHKQVRVQARVERPPVRVLTTRQVHAPTLGAVVRHRRSEGGGWALLAHVSLSALERLVGDRLPGFCIAQ